MYKHENDSINLRSLLSLGVKRIPHGLSLGPLHRPLDKFVVNGLLNHEAGGGGAHLALE